MPSVASRAHRTTATAARLHAWPAIADAAQGCQPGVPALALAGLMANPVSLDHHEGRARQSTGWVNQRLLTLKTLLAE